MTVETFQKANSIMWDLGPIERNIQDMDGPLERVSLHFQLHTKDIYVTNNMSPEDRDMLKAVIEVAKRDLLVRKEELIKQLEAL